MVNAVEESFLIYVLDEWRARTLWVETGSSLTPPLTSTTTPSAASSPGSPQWSLISSPGAGSNSANCEMVPLGRCRYLVPIFGLCWTTVTAGCGVQIYGID
jgi:hypothetical protein